MTSHVLSGIKVEMESGSVLDNLQIQIQIKKIHCERTVENFLLAAHIKRQNTVDNICMHLHISQKQKSIYTHSVRNV